VPHQALLHRQAAALPKPQARRQLLGHAGRWGLSGGELAKCFYPTGVEISSPNNAEAEAQTLEWLKQDKVVLFEPAIRFENFFVRADILMDDSLRKYATFQ
jgi:hypothetical protein